MKVKELIERLSEMDQDADVTVQAWEGCHGPGDTYEISGTDFFEASSRYNTPASAFIEVGDGCFCDGHRGSKIKKLGLGPQNISQFYLGLEAAADVAQKSLDWYVKELQRIGKAKDYQESLDVMRYEQGKHNCENILRDIGKLQNRGEQTS